MKITLPFFPVELRPNKKSCWQKKKRFSDKYKSDCYYATKAIVKEFKTDKKRIPMTVLFYPPYNRGFDCDNSLSAIKSGLDGMAKALNIDDVLFRPVTIDIPEVDKKNPRVEITINN